MRTTPIAAPLATAQVSASRHVVSGSSGLAGGSLPVATFQVEVAIFRATMDAPTAVPRPRTRQASAAPATAGLPVSDEVRVEMKCVSAELCVSADLPRSRGMNPAHVNPPGYPCSDHATLQILLDHDLQSCMIAALVRWCAW